MPDEVPTPHEHTDPSGGGSAGEDSGLEPNVAGALSYLLGPVTGILFLVIDKRPFVRFHAAQCLVLAVVGIALAVALVVLSVILGMIPVLGWIVNLLLSLVLWVAGFALWLYLMYQAFQGNEWEIPVVGEYARRLTSKM